MENQCFNRSDVNIVTINRGSGNEVAQNENKNDKKNVLRRILKIYRKNFKKIAAVVVVCLFIASTVTIYYVLELRNKEKMTKLTNLMSVHGLTCGRFPKTGLVENTVISKRRAGRIISGDTTSVAEIPWQVSLWYSGKIVCGASIVTNKWLITAAHCVGTSMKTIDFTVYAGLTNISNLNDVHVQRITLSKIISHPKYVNDNTFRHDIALLKLDAELRFSSHVSSICIPSPNLPINLNSKHIISGFGDTAYQFDDYDTNTEIISNNFLHSVDVHVVTHESCIKTFEEVMGEKGHITDTMMCASAYSGDACEGDSGGPLSYFSQESGVWILPGIISWGLGCGFSFPGVYTDVSKFVNWIWLEIGIYD